jgi:flagellar biosynthesis/type III secretory pathway protein FliH
MSEFCTSCGAQNSGSAFCTACGAPQAASTASPVVHTKVEPVSMASPVTQTNVSESTPPATQNTSSKKKILIYAFSSIVILVCGIGGFFAGKASIDLDKERSVAYDSGYQEGQAYGISNGREMGYNDGFNKGKTAGCMEAFEFNDGTWQHIISWNPDAGMIAGRYYKSRIGC